jgi:hypothetical protein
MILADVNVLVHAFRADAPRHNECRRWLEETVNSNASFGLSDLVLSGFLRVVTHPRVFAPPAPLEEALRFTETLRSQPNCLVISPGSRHWAIFTGLCQVAETMGNLVPDAFLAALAIESGSTWITTDRDFSRFPELDWSAPVAPGS